MVRVNPKDDGGDGGASSSGGDDGGSGGGGGGFFLGSRRLQQQHGGPAGVSLPGATDSLTTAGSAATATVPEDPNKKVRKPYTITKSRENWTDQEHDKFIEALQLFDRDWKKIEAFIGSKTVIQIRSHAQKYFLKVQKNGTSDHVPPPRPKRKAAHPYPQKASKNALLLSQSIVPFQTSSSISEPGYAFGTDTYSMLGNSSARATVSSWASSSVQPNASHITKVMPDFAQVYSFIGSVFDPSTGGHLQKLKEMDPIDVETVLLLMKNLSINLNSPDFEDHRRLLSSSDVGIKELGPVSINNMLLADIPMSAPST